MTTILNPSRRRVAAGSEYVCLLCQHRSSARPSPYRLTKSQRRTIKLRTLERRDDYAQQWADQAKAIRGKEKSSMLSILEERGYINQIAGTRGSLDALLTDKRVGVYIGIDPTAASLHVGHLVPLMCLFWMFVHGFKTVSLIGGATAQIGDPTGRTKSREQMKRTERKLNMVNVHYQLKTIWANMEDHATKKHGYKWEWIWHREIVNNNTWMNKLPLLEMLKLIGTGTRVGTMLGRDTVRTKMESGEGISFAEFTYPLMQAYDWWHMYNEKGIQVQIGGSDQYGNIIAGIDAVNHVRKTHPHPDIQQVVDDPLMAPMGFTVPLLTTASGEKFGKSAGNAVWLGADMTSPFELYQYFLRTADADVDKYLRLFTFISIPEIQRILEESRIAPSRRLAQKRLAQEVVTLIHGPTEVMAAERETATVFGSSGIPAPDPTNADRKPATTIKEPRGDWSSALNKVAPATTSQNRPASNITLPRSLVYNQPIARVLYSAGLVSSRSEGHRLASERGAYIGSLPGQKGGMGDKLEFTPALNWKPEETWKYVIDGELMILRVGKWKVKIVKIVDDEEFERSGVEAPPGWEELREKMKMKTEKEEVGVVGERGKERKKGEEQDKVSKREKEKEAIDAGDGILDGKAYAS
ncbi:tyrosyl-tRNA synthetase [Agyrium rufum]|nr:tyrosyl-tRNA synthetase [Agyrium rufum]